MSEIFCLALDGPGLTEKMRECLFRGAQILAREKDRTLWVKTKEFEGVIGTDFDTAGSDGVRGVLFAAEIQSAWGKSTLRFIVPTRDLEGVDDRDKRLSCESALPESPPPEKAMLN